MKIYVDPHTHTIASIHAYSTILENARFAADRGLKAIGITDHAPALVNSTKPEHFKNLRTLPEEVYGVKLLPGVELNIMNVEGDIDLDLTVLKRMTVVIASIHEQTYEITTAENHTKSFINVMKNPYVRIMGHLADGRIPFDMPAVVKAAIETNTLIEINNLSFNPISVRRSVPALVELISVCRALGAKIVLGSDAHFATQVGDFNMAMPYVIEAGYPEELILNADAERFLAFINKPKNNPN